MLKEYDMKRDSVELTVTRPNGPIMQYGTEKHMELRPGYTLEQLWARLRTCHKQKNNHVR